MSRQLERTMSDQGETIATMTARREHDGSAKASCLALANQAQNPLIY